MIDALYGARFKVSAVDTPCFLTSPLITNATWVQSWVGGQGITENIKYHDIRLYNVTYPIAVTQTYVDQNNPGGDRVNNGSVILKNFSFKGAFLRLQIVVLRSCMAVPDQVRRIHTCAHF